jgi:hypothetical protein
MSGNLLTAHIFEPGTKFEVTEHTMTKAFPPGSIGFISNYGGQFRTFPNVILAEASIIRRGRKGKDRIERVTFASPVFDVGQRVTEAKYHGYHFVYVEPIENIYKSVLTMPELDFLGWGFAYCSYLVKIYRDMENRWPKEKYRPVNTMKRIVSYFNDDPINALKNFCNPDYIESLITEMRNLESLALRAGIKQKKGVTVAKLKALLYFVWVNIHCRRDKYQERFPQKDVLVTIEHYLKILRDDQRKEFELDQKRFEAYSKGKKKTNLLSKPSKPQPPRKLAEMITLLEELAPITNSPPNLQEVLLGKNKNLEKASYHGGYIVVNEDMVHH